MSSMVVSTWATVSVAPASGGLADEAAQHVGGAGKVLRARAVADAVDRHRRHPAGARSGQRGQDGGARRRDELGADAGVDHREAAQQLGRRRGRAPASGRAGRPTNPPPSGSAETWTFSTPSRCRAITRAGDVDDRVDRADVVEVHRLDAGAVHARLGLGQPGEDPRRAVRSPPAAARCAPRIARMSRSWRCVMADLRRRARRRPWWRGRRRGGPRGVSSVDSRAAPACQLGPQRRQRHAGVDQRAQDHVAARRRWDSRSRRTFTRTTSAQRILATSRLIWLAWWAAP